MRNTLLKHLICALVTLFVCGTVAMAQVESGQIVGTVLDQSGAVVINANVTVKNLDTNAERSTHTSSIGTYSVPGLQPGHYQLTVTSVSFKPYSANVEVTVGRTITVNAKLSVSSNVTEVQVIAEGGAQVNTQTQELSTVVDTQQLAQLPSLTRNPYDFVAMSGNVSNGDNTSNSNGTNGQSLSPRGVGYAINGQRESGVEILLDGVENVSIFSVAVGEDIPMDAVQEYSVITNNFSAEYGRASGGVVNVTTKAGTNKYHGSVWEFNRLSAYTANTFENDVNEVPKGKYTRNMFGFQGGGPILKNKLFISETTEWTRVRSAAVEPEEIFDPAFIAMLPANAKSFFNTYATTPVASTGVAATANQIVGTWTSATVNTCFFGTNVANTACLPFPQINGTTTVPGTTPVFDAVNIKAPFDAGGGLPENQYMLVGRVDYNVTDKTQMFFRAGRENNNQFNGSNSYSAYPQYDTGTAILNQSYLYSLSHTFSNTLFANAKASFTRFNNATSYDHALNNTPNLMFVTPTDPYTGGTISTPGLENTNQPGEGGLPYGGPQNTIQFVPDVSWTRGKHSMRFGATFTYIQMNLGYGAYEQALEQLGSTSLDSMNDLINAAGGLLGSQLTTFSTRVNPQGKLPCYTTPEGVAINPSSCLVTPPLTAPSPERSYRYKDWAIYGQDSYKVTPKLTLNYGLRWEHYGVQHNNNPALDSNFYYGTGTTLETQVRNGEVYVTGKSPVGGFWKPRWGTLAPRVGFAYDVFGDGKTSLRGGVGISYERNFGNVTFNASFNPPASAVPNVICSAGDASCPIAVTNQDLGVLGVAGPAMALAPVELRFMDPNIEVAQTQFWSLTLQHRLSRSTVAEAGYSGAHGIHLYDMENVNQAGAGQVYLGDALQTSTGTGSLCANTGFIDEGSKYVGGVTNTNPTYTCLTRPTSQYSNINRRGSNGVSSYNALNLNVQSENIRNTGLTLVANYTWSHSLDVLSSTFSDSLQGGSGYIGSLGYTNLLDPKLDWGSSDFDIRQRFAVTPIWELPWFKHDGTLVEREALGGWNLSSIFTIRSGIPFSVYDDSNVENQYTWPRLTPATPITQYKVGKPQVSGTAGVFNVMTLPVPASTAPLNPITSINGSGIATGLGMSDFGPFPAAMTHRNAFRGPGAWNDDLALDKKFPITERVNMEFRAEGFNVFNHHNYYVEDFALAYAYSGTPFTPITVQELKGGLGSYPVTGNHDERRFGQFALKLVF
jgi:hypothetical protein